MSPCPTCEASPPPDGQPCPSCGGVRLGVPAAAGIASAGAIGIVVDRALAELASMSNEELWRMIRAHEARAPSAARTASVTVSGYVEDGARVIDDARGEIAYQGSAVEWLVRHPIYGAVILGVAGNLATDALKAVLSKLLPLIAAGQLTAAQPGARAEDGRAPGPVPVLARPAPQQPPPPANVCLPADEPGK